MRALQPRSRRNDCGLGCSPFARHYLGNHGCFLFLRVLRCFSSPGSPPKAYVFSQGMTGLQPAGLPHSEIHGSMLVCSSPWLIAAYHVLHRLSMPRHPPYALTCLSLTALQVLGIYRSVTLGDLPLVEESSCQRTRSTTDGARWS